MNKQDLEPHQVVLDLVLKYSATMPRVDHAAVLNGNLILLAKNHRGMAYTLSFPVHFDGEPFEGDALTSPRFMLRKLGSTVWKLAPSILHDMLHAFITIVGVPEDVTWGQT
jgi:hypothetical protein